MKISACVNVHASIYSLHISRFCSAWLWSLSESERDVYFEKTVCINICIIIVIIINAVIILF